MTAKEFRIGELIENRYRVLDVIGKGGMGMLYRVADEAQNDDVAALKMMRLKETESPEQVKRFQREFQLLTQLRHPNLVSVYDYGITAESGLYFTMEWVEGRDLEPGGRQMDIESSISIVVQVCRALAYLHSRGVIHGDLKPANVLLDDAAADDAGDTSHRVRIVDFGIALEMRSPEIRMRYYSAGYSAPEMKKARPIDQRADLYSLGALWYALLLGEPPLFMFSAEQMIRFALNEALEGHDLAHLGDVIAQLLATSPDERHASANEVIEAINRVTGSTFQLETRETAGSYALRTHFVNRETEMEVLEAMWQQARSGAGKLLLVSGESGVGKTRLVEELKVRAEMEGARVVWGQCVEHGSSAYQPWREVLRVLVRYVEGDGQSHNVGLDMKRGGPVLATILPELWERNYMAGLAPPAELGLQAAQQRLHSTIVQVLRAAVELRATMIVIENAQWADEATLAMLSFLTRSVGDLRLLVCVTYRSDEISPEHSLVRLMGDQVQRIPVQALSPKVSTDLACSMLGLEELPLSLAERLRRTTGGNALFVQELIRSLAAEGEVLRRTVAGWQVDQKALESVQLPRSIQQVIERRLGHLSLEARRVLRWAAVMGIVCWEGGIVEIGGVVRSQVRMALREVLGLGLLLARDESAFGGEREYLFTNPTVREVSYESVPGEQRRDCHGRAAAWLLERRDDEIDVHLGLISEHLERSGQTEKAVTYLRRAGEQAAAQFANVDAIQYWNRALDLIAPGDLVGRYDVVMTRERVYHLLGAREEQSQDLADLAELVEALNDDQRRIALALRRVGYTKAISDFGACIAAAQEAMHLAQGMRDVRGEAEAAGQWGEALWRQGAYDASRSILERALGLAREAGSPEIEALSLYNLGAVPFFQGNYAKASYYNGQALRFYREVGDRSGESKTLNNLGIMARELYNYEQSKIHLEQALNVAQEIGDRRSEGLIRGNLGELLETVGDYAEAQVDFEQAVRLAREIGDRYLEGGVTGSLGSLFMLMGNYDKAREHLEQARSILRESGSRMFEGKAVSQLSLLSLRLGDDETALEYGRQALEIGQKISLPAIEGPAQTYRGHALAGLGCWTEAADAYQQALDLYPRRERPHLVLEPLAGLAHVLLAQGELHQAQVRVEEMLDHLENEAIKSIVSLGQVYVYWVCYKVLRANRDSRAQAVLEAVYQVLQRRAAKIGGEELRRSFLENVPYHREIVREWERIDESTNDV